MNKRRVNVEPFFLLGTKGKLFSLFFSPITSQKFKTAILFVPPFAEELNKSRRMIAMQSRKFAELNYPVLVVDLYGTGDSEGDFSEATWETWISDLQHAVRWLSELGVKNLIIWCLRTGALLALHRLQQFEIPVSTLVLWQPVIKGSGFITQFLRLRLAADIISERNKNSLVSLREQFDNGHNVEISGYSLSAELYQGLNKGDLFAANLQGVNKIIYFELATSADRPFSAPTKKIIEKWKNENIDMVAEIVMGEQFWSTPEIAVAPNLIESTSKYFATR